LKYLTTATIRSIGSCSTLLVLIEGVMAVVVLTTATRRSIGSCSTLLLLIEGVMAVAVPYYCRLGGKHPYGCVVSAPPWASPRPCKTPS